MSLVSRVLKSPTTWNTISMGQSVLVFVSQRCSDAYKILGPCIALVGVVPMGIYCVTNTYKQTTLFFKTRALSKKIFGLQKYEDSDKTLRELKKKYFDVTESEMASCVDDDKKKQRIIEAKRRGLDEVIGKSATRLLERCCLDHCSGDAHLTKEAVSCLFSFLKSQIWRRYALIAFQVLLILLAIGFCVSLFIPGVNLVTMSGLTIMAVVFSYAGTGIGVLVDRILAKYWMNEPIFPCLGKYNDRYKGRHYSQLSLEVSQG